MVGFREPKEGATGDFCRVFVGVFRCNLNIFGRPKSVLASLKRFAHMFLGASREGEQLEVFR